MIVQIRGHDTQSWNAKMYDKNLSTRYVQPVTTSTIHSFSSGRWHHKEINHASKIESDMTINMH